jgi:hypothetical protein
VQVVSSRSSGSGAGSLPGSPSDPPEDGVPALPLHDWLMYSSQVKPAPQSASSLHGS